MSTATIPVLLAPGHLTKHLKVFLDKTEWRDKTKLIIRYSQIAGSDQSLADSATTAAAVEPDKCDLSQCMAIALQPVGPFLPKISLNSNSSGGISSLWDLTHILSSSSDLSAIDWPTPLSDPLLQKSIYLTYLSPSTFPAPRHILAQTPLEKLQQSVSEFLLPYLQSWAIEHTEEDVSKREHERLTPEILPSLIATLPQKWEHYSDFTFLPPTAFLTGPWPAMLKYLVTLDQDQNQQNDKENLNGIMAQWEKLVQDAFGSSHIARKAIIPVEDVLRRPKIRPLAGDWKLHNRYKSWIEEDSNSNLVQHQEMSNGLNSSKIIDKNNISVSKAKTGSETTGLYESSIITTTTSTSSSSHPTDPDVLPTDDNIFQTYWAETCQNQVWYCWSPMFTMFSAGNITEKERVAKSRPIFDARDKVVVDLYAGIGYFTLVYLIHAGARTVHACEWNPWSVQGLIRGAIWNEIPWKRYHGDNIKVANGGKGDEELNTELEQPFTTGVPYPRRPTTTSKKQKEYGQLVVYPGDNAQWIQYFENTAHHINLGLIPSAEPGWVLGVRALCPKEGGYLHVHHNIRVGEEEAFQRYLLQSLRELFKTWKSENWSIVIRHMENVKSFAPLVFHYVVDVECRPLITDTIL
ncbi:tRNA methyltransferase tyw3 [Linnemannia zychae]|nr:tRNA methyltransferase tyw3 [Linnemannia zychae]